MTNGNDVSYRAEPWDAIVVGSGATGGVAARQLSQAGLKVLLLEAGPSRDRREHYGNTLENFSRHVWRHFISGRQSVQQLHATYWTTHPDFFVDDIDNPYTTPEDRPFRWIRGRTLGGRTQVWDGVTPRFSDFEFKAASRDGIGTDWPISHADLAPYYAELERFLGIRGTKDGLEQLPDGDYRVAGTMTPSERIFKARVEPKFKDRKVIISRGIPAGRSPRGNEVHSRLSSMATTLNAAVRTGRVTVRADSVVARILVKPDGSAATGVEFVDAVSHKSYEVKAKLVFLCASTIESLRILMNSESPAHPEGIGGSSGVLGRYLMDHIAGNVYFHMPDVPDDGPTYDLFGSDAILIPRYQNLNGRHEDYPRGFGMWGGIQRIGVHPVLHKKRGEAFGFLTARGEAIPRRENRVELDPEVRDAWGIPAAHINFQWSEEDLKTARAGKADAEEMIRAAKGIIVPLTDLFRMPIIGGAFGLIQKEWVRSTPGLFAHEVGGARMGTSPKDSVLDPYCRAWDAPNVFVTDGAAWPSCGWQNPTLTEMALTARACDIAVQELKRS